MAKAKRSVSKPKRRAPAFSVVTIARNESHRLPLLLESLQAFRSAGGEVVVLDTGSEDDTVRIAKDAGCVVHREPRRFNRVLTAEQTDRIHASFARDGEGPFVHAGDRVFNIALARNAADAYARNPFVLCVDGSDVIEAMDIAFLDEQVRLGAADVLLFETRRMQRHRWVLEQRDYFHDRRKVRWFGRAHNRTVNRDAKDPAKVTSLPRSRLRVTHNTDSGKSRTYQLTGLALDVLDSPKLAHRRLLLAHELGARGYNKSALALALALDHAEAPGFVRAAGLALAASLMQHAGAAEDETTELLFRAIRRDPTHRHAYLLLARSFLAKSEFQLAASFANAALAIPSRVTMTQAEEDLQDGPHAVLYWALFWLGRKSEAKGHFETCIGFAPNNPVYRDHARLFA